MYCFPAVFISHPLLLSMITHIIDPTKVERLNGGHIGSCLPSLLGRLSMKDSTLIRVDCNDNFKVSIFTT